MQGDTRVLAYKLPHQIPDQVVAYRVAGPDADFAALASAAGWEVADSWNDPEDRLGLRLLARA